MLTSIKGEINNNTIIVADFNTPLTPMDRSTKQKINKETQTLNDTILHGRFPGDTEETRDIKGFGESYHHLAILAKIYLVFSGQFFSPL